jgi:glycosyltransferase involved in cell wall biosynthesis
VSQGVLYISYDGMLEPLGQGQVLAYLERLAAGRPIHLISFEKESDWRDKARLEATRQRIAAAGIAWHPLRYHKRPSAAATAYDIAIGTARAIALVRRHGLRILHARSYVPALMALMVKRVTGAKFLFDMRGFWADERVDGGLWPAGGRLFRITKALERRFLRAADHVVTLTRASQGEILNFDYLREAPPPISVIPTCADLDRFTIQGALQRDPFVLGYVGSVGTWYLLDEMLRFFLLLRRALPGTKLLVVNRNEQRLIRERAKLAGLEEADIEILAADHADVPRHIVRMTAGMALYKPSYSRVACAPTKLAEYLGCGVPVIGSVGVGDVSEIIGGARVGIVLHHYSDEAIRSGVASLLALVDEAEIQARCRKTAVELFSLAAGTSAYDSIYRQLGN